jgi:thiamine-monophosphate kinase
MPSPLVEVGLAARGFATAGIDISDGFLRDLGRLCAASGVGAEVECDALPAGGGASVTDALAGGEDYSLLFSVPRRKLPLLRRAVACAEVGRLTRAGGIRLTEGGRPRPLPAVTGFDHLR